MWVSSSLGLLPFRGLKLRLHIFSFDPVVKSLLFIFSELHVLILLILLILKLHDLTWAQMSHSLLDRHFHDLGERQFISILRNEFVHFLCYFLGPELLLIIDVLLVFVVDSGVDQI